MDEAWLVIPCLIGCGRVGFGPALPPVDASGDGAPTDSAGTALLSSQVTCQSSPTTLILDRDAQAGSTLAVAFFAREPVTATVPTIAGGTSWQHDVSFSSAVANNRRHFSLFRAVLASTVAAGTEVKITHPAAESTGAALFIGQGPVTRPVNESTAAYEGEGAFSGASATMGSDMLCAVVHHNTTSIQFAPEWQLFYELSSDCGGGARQTAGMHLAVAPGGQTDCRGALGNASFTWITVQVGYDGFAVQ